ncbi:hypothetical protein Droror1_Dr00025932 [Drosera rotundifolia]
MLTARLKGKHAHCPAHLRRIDLALRGMAQHSPAHSRRMLPGMGQVLSWPNLFSRRIFVLPGAVASPTNAQLFGEGVEARRSVLRSRPCPAMRKDSGDDG